MNAVCVFLTSVTETRPMLVKRSVTQQKPNLPMTRSTALSPFVAVMVNATRSNQNDALRLRVRRQGLEVGHGPKVAKGQRKSQN